MSYTWDEERNLDLNDPSYFAKRDAYDMQKSIAGGAKTAQQAAAEAAGYPTIQELYKGLTAAGIGGPGSLSTTPEAFAISQASSNAGLAGGDVAFQLKNPYYGQTGYFGDLAQVQSQVAGKAQSPGIPQGVLDPSTYTQNPAGQPAWQPAPTPQQNVAADQASWGATRFPAQPKQGGATPMGTTGPGQAGGGGGAAMGIPKAPAGTTYGASTSPIGGSTIYQQLGSMATMGQGGRTAPPWMSQTTQGGGGQAPPAQNTQVPQGQSWGSSGIPAGGYQQQRPAAGGTPGWQSFLSNLGGR